MRYLRFMGKKTLRRHTLVRSLLGLLVFFTVETYVLPNGITTAATTPHGAVNLSKSNLAKIGSVQCGKVKGKWIAGTLIGSRLFISHLQQKENATKTAKHLRGHSQSAMKAQAAKWARRSIADQSKCDSKNVSSNPTLPGTTIPNSSTTNGKLTFNLKNASAIVLKDGGVSAQSLHKNGLTTNLFIIDKTGKVSLAVQNGAATIQRVFVAPNNKIYLQGWFQIQGDSEKMPCVLVQVDRITGDYLCVESDISFRFETSDRATNSTLHNGFQFDEEGSIYYLGVPSSSHIAYPGYSISDGNGVVIRRFKNGTTSDLVKSTTMIEDPYQAFFGSHLGVFTDEISNFLVMPDGHVLVDQQHSTRIACSPTNAVCFKRTYTLDLYDSAGSKSEITGLQLSPDPESPEYTRLGHLQFMKLFPDGKPYVDWLPIDISTKSAGISKYLDYSASNPRFRMEDIGCQAGDNSVNVVNLGSVIAETVCSSTASQWRRYWTNPFGDSFALLGRDGGFGFSTIGSLIRISPTPRIIRTTIANIESMTTALGYVFISGVTSNNRHTTLMVNPDTNAEIELISSSQDVSVSYLAYQQSSNELFVSGQRNSDGLFVIGVVNLSTKIFSILSSSTTPPSDLISLSS